MPAVEKRKSGLLSAQFPVIAGFAIVILLMLAVAATGVVHLRLLNGQLTGIVARQHQKSELTVSMRTLHEARYQGLLLASRLDEAQARAEQRRRFTVSARDFAALRERYISLPLDDLESAAWGEVRKQQEGIETLANTAFDLLQANSLEQARHLIRAEIKPRESHLMNQWNHLVDMQRYRKLAALDQAASASEHALRLAFVLSTLALLLAFAVAVFVIRVSRRLERDLFQERERAIVTLRSLGDAVIRFDAARHIAYLNPIAETLLGMEETRSTNLPVGEVLHLFERESRADLTTRLLDEVLAGRTYILPPPACLLSSLGMEYELEGKASCIHDLKGGISGGILVMSDVSEARELQRKLLWQSDHDALTGLGNRYALEESLARALGERRAAGVSGSLLLISLEPLKRVRIKAGQACSNELVFQVALLLHARMRESDFLARMSEDEFAVVLQPCPDEMRIAERIRDDVMAFRLLWEGNTYQIGVHVGVVRLSGQTREDSLTAAYAALREAESQGAGSVVHQAVQDDRIGEDTNTEPTRHGVQLTLEEMT